MISVTHHPAPQVILHVQEAYRMCAEAMSAMEARNISSVGFYDCSGGSIGAIMGMMECELLRVQGSAEALHDDARGESKRN